MAMFHVHALKTLSPSAADDWIVIAKQHRVCALKELRNERLEKGLDPPQWMQIVKVNLLKTETSWATRVGIVGLKQAIDLDISAVPRSEAADKFLMHLRDSPATPDESAREHIHRTIPKPASGSAWIPPQVSDDELQVCFLFRMPGLANCNLATYPPPVQTYAVKAFDPFFTWVYHAEDAAVQSLDNLEKMKTPMAMNQQKFLQSLYEPALLQRVAADMLRPKTNIKEIQDGASTYRKQQWINWHWGAAPDSVIHPSRSMFP